MSAIQTRQAGKLTGPGYCVLPVEDFDDLVRRYRRELHVHCYRMLGSFDEAEEHVQEVFLRAWRSHECFQARSSPRTWLYRVATNACLDTLRRDARRAVPAGARTGAGPSVTALPWMQPYPDSLLDEMAAASQGRRRWRWTGRRSRSPSW